MSDQQDEDQKTEEPSEKRLREAMEKGDVPRARDVGQLAGLAGLWLVAVAAAPLAASILAETLLPLIENPDDIRLDGSAQDVAGTLRWVVGGTALALAPAIGVLFFSGLAGAFGQGPVLAASDRIQPKLSNISPLSGWKRMFGGSALVEFVKSLIKLAIVAAAAWSALAPFLTWTEAVVGIDVAALPDLLRDLTLRLLLAVLLATVLMAVVDVLWRRFEWRKRLRMTFQEVKDEMKQSEGDPHIKARIRDIRRQRARRRMMQGVPRATVVIANPTHYAVALEYDRATMPAPKCIAKGADLIALRIRAVAEESGVPVVENPPLARALHASAEIDALIPIQHYQAVAEVIMYVLKLSGKAPARRDVS